MLSTEKRRKNLAKTIPQEEYLTQMIKANNQQRRNAFSVIEGLRAPVDQGSLDNHEPHWDQEMETIDEMQQWATKYAGKSYDKNVDRLPIEEQTRMKAERKQNVLQLLGVDPTPEVIDETPDTLTGPQSSLALHMPRLGAINRRNSVLVNLRGSNEIEEGRRVLAFQDRQAAALEDLSDPDNLAAVQAAQAKFIAAAHRALDWDEMAALKRAEIDDEVW